MQLVALVRDEAPSLIRYGLSECRDFAIAIAIAAAIKRGEFNSRESERTPCVEGREREREEWVRECGGGEGRADWWRRACQ